MDWKITCPQEGKLRLTISVDLPNPTAFEPLSIDAEPLVEALMPALLQDYLYPRKK